MSIYSSLTFGVPSRYLRWMAFAAFLLWLTAIIMLSLLPFRTISFLAPSLPDNTIHFVTYCAGALLACLCFPRPVLIWVGLTFIGAIVELTQGWIGTGRSSELEEGYANALGALLGVAVAMILRAVFQHLQKRH